MLAVVEARLRTGDTMMPIHQEREKVRVEEGGEVVDPPIPPRKDRVLVGTPTPAVGIGEKGKEVAALAGMEWERGKP